MKEKFVRFAVYLMAQSTIFCKNCGAALEPSGRQTAPVADVFSGRERFLSMDLKEGAVDTAAAGKPGRPSSAGVWRA